MATVADLWGEPEVKPKGGASDISPKQKSFSTYKNGIEINEQIVPHNHKAQPLLTCGNLRLRQLLLN